MAISWLVTNPDNLFFTADPHFFHENIIKYCNRPYSNAGEMNEALISNFNEKVPEDGITFFIGDIGMAKQELLAEVFSKLNGSKYLVRGNHDPRQIHTSLGRHLKDLGPLLTLKVREGQDATLTHKVILCHYAMRTWDSKHHGAWHLYGHSHGRLPELKNFSTDVGVDPNNYYPVSYRELQERFSDHEQDRYS